MNPRHHPTNFHEEPEVSELIRRAGWSAYGRYIAILDIIAASMPPGGQPELAHHPTWWINTLGMKTKTFSTLLRTYRDLKLLTSKRTRNILKISAPKLLQQRSKYHRDWSGPDPSKTTTPPARSPVHGDPAVKDPGVKTVRRQTTRIFNKFPGWGIDQVIEIANALPDSIANEDQRGGLLLAALQHEAEEGGPTPGSRPAEREFVGLIGTRQFTAPDTQVEAYQAMKRKHDDKVLPTLQPGQNVFTAAASLLTNQPQPPNPEAPTNATPGLQ